MNLFVMESIKVLRIEAGIEFNFSGNVVFKS